MIKQPKPYLTSKLMLEYLKQFESHFLEWVLEWSMLLVALIILWRKPSVPSHNRIMALGFLCS